MDDEERVLAYIDAHPDAAKAQQLRDLIRANRALRDSIRELKIKVWAVRIRRVWLPLSFAGFRIKFAGSQEIKLAALRIKLILAKLHTELLKFGLWALRGEWH